MENQASRSDEFERVKYQILSMRENVQEGADIVEDTISRYHSLLDRLEKLDIEVKDFRLPDTSFFRQEEGPFIMRGSQRTSPIKYSDKRYIRYADFMERIDALLMYLPNTPENLTGRIGFEKG